MSSSPAPSDRDAHAAATTELREPPAGLAAASTFGCLLEDAEQGALAYWTMGLAEFVQRVASLDPSLGLLDAHGLVRDARAILKEGGLNV